MKRYFLLALVMLLLTGCAAAPEAAVDAPAPTEPEIRIEIVDEAEEETKSVVFELNTEEVVFTEPEQQMMICDEALLEAEILWVSQDETVATVTDGLVTAVSRGETTITARYEDQEQSCRVVCDLPVPLVLNEGAGINDPVYLPPEVEIVDDSFFDDALFVGDSQGWAFYSCVKYAGYLPNAKHMTRNGYSVDSAANDRMLMSWRGKNCVLKEAIAMTEAKRVFFMMGINDIAHYKVEEMDQIMANWKKLLDGIQERNPDVQLCVQSLLPVWTEGQTKDITNEKVNEYNRLLKALAEENGWVYIDLATYFVDSTGGMATCYCSDKYVHVNAAGVDTWVKVLKACTDYE